MDEEVSPPSLRTLAFSRSIVVLGNRPYLPPSVSLHCSARPLYMCYADIRIPSSFVVTKVHHRLLLLVVHRSLLPSSRATFLTPLEPTSLELINEDVDHPLPPQLSRHLPFEHQAAVLHPAQDSSPSDMLSKAQPARVDRRTPLPSLNLPTQRQHKSTSSRLHQQRPVQLPRYLLPYITVPSKSSPRIASVRRRHTLRRTLLLLRRL